LTISRVKLLDKVKQAGLSAILVGEGKEIAIRCPKCSPKHVNRRFTLYVNADSGSFICHRCIPKFAGLGGDGERRIASLDRVLRELGVDSSGLDVPVSANLNELRARLRGVKKINAAPPASQAIALPDGYRTDFAASLTGRMVKKYLLGRGVTEKIIDQLSVGYSAKGDLWGYAIFPVVMNSMLKFWQARSAIIGKTPVKYLSCTDVKVTEVLYGYDRVNPCETVTLVEGIFDSLSTPNSLALLGKNISTTQILALQAKNIANIRVMLDGDAHAAGRAVARQIRSKLPKINFLQIALLPDGVDPASSGAFAASTIENC